MKWLSNRIQQQKKSHKPPFLVQLEHLNLRYQLQLLGIKL